MKKPELISAVATHSGFSRRDVEIVLSAFSAVAESALKEGKKVPLVGLGKLVPHFKRGRRWRLPDGSMGKSSPRKTAKFVPAKTLLTALND